MQYTERASIAVLLTLAYQSFGVVYGDLSVSPLYVFRATFGDTLRNDVEEREIMGVLCFIFWTLTLIPVIKYSFIVLSAHDNGEGAAAFSLFLSLNRKFFLYRVMKILLMIVELQQGLWF